MVSLATQKGGSGKTSLATSLAVVAAEAGEIVGLVDLDPQRSAVSWRARRRQDVRDIPTEFCTPARLPHIRRDMQDRGVTLLIHDTPGILDAAGAVAFNSSFAMVPVRPSILDVEAARATVDQLKRLGTQFGLVLNGINPTTPNRTLDAAKALASIGLLAPLVIANRTDFLDAMTLGLGVTEYAPTGKAAGEVQTLWTWIAPLLKEAPK